jgi:hypothetical protein
MTLKQRKEVEEFGFDRIRIGDKTYSVIGIEKQKGSIVSVYTKNKNGDNIGMKLPIRVYDTDISFYNSEKSIVKNRDTEPDKYFIKFVK